MSGTTVGKQMCDLCKDQRRADGAELACESVICNEAPDDEANAALEALAKAIG